MFILGADWVLYFSTMPLKSAVGKGIEQRVGQGVVSCAIIRFLSLASRIHVILMPKGPTCLQFQGVYSEVNIFFSHGSPATPK